MRAVELDNVSIKATLLEHIKSCDKRATEGAWWLRFIGGSVALILLGYAVKTIYHIPL